jgi:hypothetical protein
MIGVIDGPRDWHEYTADSVHNPTNKPGYNELPPYSACRECIHFEGLVDKRDNTFRVFCGSTDEKVVTTIITNPKDHTWDGYVGGKCFNSDFGYDPSLLKLITPDISGVSRHREWAKDGNRYQIHSILSNIRYRGEPIVPKILSEPHLDQHGIKVYYAEKMLEPGTENAAPTLGEVILDEDLPLNFKLGILIDCLGQFQAMENSGIVLFDRHWSNILVVGAKPVQVDLETIFFTNTDELIYSGHVGMTLDILQGLKDRGYAPWATEVKEIALAASEILKNVHKVIPINQELFDKYLILHNNSKPPKDPITELRHELSQIRRDLNTSKIEGP